MREHSDELFAPTAHAAGIGVWEWDVATDAVTWSAEVLELFGVAAEELDGTYRSYLALIPPDERQQVVETIEATLATGERYSVEHRLERNDGSVIWFAGFGSVVRDDLERAGYSVLEAKDGDHAIEVESAYERPIDLLLTDVIMPTINGRELSKALTARRPRLKTIYFSGYAADVISDHGVLDTCVEFVQKPFVRAELLERVRRVLDERS